MAFIFNLRSHAQWIAIDENEIQNRKHESDIDL